MTIILRTVPFLVLLLFGSEAMAFRIQSPAFEDKGDLPAKYTCDGENISPPLAWTEAPQGTKSFALITDDPDSSSGTWVHWVLYDLPVETTQLQEGIQSTEILADGSKHGITDFRKADYGGPCPPPGNAHRYIFKLYALDQMLGLPPKASKAELLVAMNGHVLAHAEVVGNYKRS